MRTLLSSGEIFVAANVTRAPGTEISPMLQSPRTNERRLILAICAPGFCCSDPAEVCLPLTSLEDTMKARITLARKRRIGTEHAVG
jgi:hypothetical protein